MNTACNTVLYSRGRLAEAISEIADAGYDGIELQPHHVLPLLNDRDRVRRLHDACDEAHLRVSAVMVGYLRDEDTLARNIAAAELATALGAEHVVVLPPQPWMCTEDGFAVLAGELGRACHARGVRVAMHHHAGTILDTPERIGAFAASPPHDAVGLCFDIAHYALFADDEADAAARLAEAIVYVHVKDLARRAGALDFVPGVRNAQMSFRVSGDGVLDVGPAIRRLRDSGYTGWLSVEVENFLRGRAESARLSINRIEEALA
jgi:sugar phosphate isomerase/epimerase